MDQQTIQELSSTGRPQECLQACQKLLQSEPENPLPWKYAGKSLLALGQFEKAQQYLTKAHQIDRTDPETIKDIGNSLLNLGSTADASKWYKKSLEINNNYAPSINNLANIKIQGGRIQEAAELFKRAIEADPQLIHAYVGASSSLLALGDLDQAEVIATKAIEINAQAPGLNEILGIINQNKNKPMQSIAYYQKELKVNPKKHNSLLNLGLLLLQTGQPDKAIESLKRASTINPSDECSLLLSQAYQNTGRLNEAIQEYQKINLNKSRNKMIPFNMGLCFLKSGKNIEAIETFRIAIQIDESFGAAWSNIGTALANEGRHQEALVATYKALELDPNNPDYHINLGGIYNSLGKLEQAVTSIVKSLKLRPNSPDAYMNLGGIYKDLGKLDQALSSTLKSLELKPDNPDAHMNLGAIQKNLGNLDQALSSTLKSLELRPDNPTAHKNLGAIYRSLGQIDQALSSTLKSLEIKPDDQNSLVNLGVIYQELGKNEQALACLRKAVNNDRYNERASVQLGLCLYVNGKYSEGAKILSRINTRTAANSLLSLYLCLNEKHNFNQCADHLIKKKWLNPQGIAAINHANIIYSQNLENGLEAASTMDSICNRSISEQEFPNRFIEEILVELSSGSIQPRSQTLLENGIQTSGNILNMNSEPFQALKQLLVKEIQRYNQEYDVGTDKDFKANWKKNLYDIKGWAIIMNKGGSLQSHNHETGWLTGTFYLQMPEKGASPEEGAIEFSLQGPKYPTGNSQFERKVIQPAVRDLNIFHSSLFHRTLPFESEKKRICIAFDIRKYQKAIM